MLWNLSLSITSRIDRGVTRYGRGRGRCCLSVSGDLGRSIVGASGLELEPSGRGGPQSERDLGMVEGGSGMEGLQDGE